MQRGFHHHNRNNLAGAHADALAAADTGSRLHGRHLVFGKAGQRGAGLAHRDVQIEQRLAHHGAAGQNLLRLGLEAARSLDQLLVVGSQLHVKVSGIRHRIPGHGDDLAHQGRAFTDRHVDGDHGVDIVHNTACVGGQHGGIHLPAGDGVDQGTLTALGVLGL